MRTTITVFIESWRRHWIRSKKNSDRLNLSYEKDASSGWDIYTLGHMNSVKSYDTLKNAKLTDDTSSTTAELKAYESSAKAVLMADTKTTLNTGDSDTPEPSESQDPCDENIKLTINKVWKDLNNLDHSRPNSITVTISRTWTDASSIEHTEPVSGYESYTIKGSSDKSKWQEVIKNSRHTRQMEMKFIITRIPSQKQRWMVIQQR